MLFSPWGMIWRSCSSKKSSSIEDWTGLGGEREQGSYFYSECLLPKGTLGPISLPLGMAVKGEQRLALKAPTMHVQSRGVLVKGPAQWWDGTYHTVQCCPDVEDCSFSSPLYWMDWSGSAEKNSTVQEDVSLCQAPQTNSTWSWEPRSTVFTNPALQPVGSGAPVLAPCSSGGLEDNLSGAGIVVVCSSILYVKFIWLAGAGHSHLST